jgi:hypothetical protein
VHSSNAERLATGPTKRRLQPSSKRARFAPSAERNVVNPITPSLHFFSTVLRSLAASVSRLSVSLLHLAVAFGMQPSSSGFSCTQAKTASMQVLKLL